MPNNLSDTSTPPSGINAVYELPSALNMYKDMTNSYFQRLPFAKRDIVDAQVDKWVENRIAEPCSSPYSSQVVVV
ncbi:hypothetical protein TNCV_986551 [Trichonephila clavipes]|uniref:Uncharacterized protein n=1 Tax=Trichonephila clavipes TaxID=2585209 RepID=A0A8X6VMP3_TRICX|nr:hypothetical protein TNCV_986551 [Trichonephila clavipes]